MNSALLAWSLIRVIILKAGDTISLYSVSGENSDTGTHSWGFFTGLFCSIFPFNKIYTLYSWQREESHDPSKTLETQRSSFCRNSCHFTVLFTSPECPSQVKLQSKDGSYMPAPSSSTANRSKPWSWALRASWLELRAHNSRERAPGLALPTKHGPKPTLEPRLAHIPSMLAGSQAELQSVAEVATQSPADSNISKVPHTSQNSPE